jgi:hypothetical protein
MVADADADDEVVAAMPTAAEFPAPLPPPVTVQLVAGDGTATRCWQTTFAASVTRNDDERFEARGP